MALQTENDFGQPETTRPASASQEGWGVQLRIAFLSLVALTFLTGIVYPLLVTGAARLFFHRQATGSVIEQGGKAIGSELIGQPFTDPRYFWPRPSATAPHPYNAAAGSGSNLGPTNPALVDAVRQRVEALRKSDPSNTAAIPVDLVTASASGLDPHISIAAARYQASRVARLRGLTDAKVLAFIEQHTTDRALGIIGEPVVNVQRLNLALDQPTPQAIPQPTPQTVPVATTMQSTHEGMTLTKQRAFFPENR